jgi:hypothetical protein
MLGPVAPSVVVARRSDNPTRHERHLVAHIRQPNRMLVAAGLRKAELS